MLDKSPEEDRVELISEEDRVWIDNEDPVEQQQQQQQQQQQRRRQLSTTSVRIRKKNNNMRIIICYYFLMTNDQQQPRSSSLYIMNIRVFSGSADYSVLYVFYLLLA